TWRFWEATVTLSPGEHALIVRVQDSLGMVQPLQPADVWNFKGYMNNSLHRVCVHINEGT
ncbi:MAG: molybdopterin oxidoreductase, partial [Armatimonadetes bacterium]|nr:molybdopterin oxidoreductase [Anaerolineae bacterium]